MKILFVYTSEIIPESGGVQRVTKVLADYFEDQKKAEVFYLSQKRSSNNEKAIKNHFFLHDVSLEDTKNINFLNGIVKKNKIDIIINQAALGGVMSKFCYYAKQVHDVKIVSVIHNSLLGNVENVTSSNKKILKLIPLSKFSFFLKTNVMTKILLKLYIWKYAKSYQDMYSFSDKVVLLSKSYFSQLQLFVKGASQKKVISIHNPCTINENYKEVVKKNELLYVGRINKSQKRVDLLLEIWSKVYKKYPTWRLNIIGEGEDSEVLEKKSKKMKLERVKFFGVKNPVPFYSSAKIFCMTSSYEGFPLVLAEAHKYKLIPILFNSFPAVCDIINNNKNGVLITPFDVGIYVKELSNLMASYSRVYETYSKGFVESEEKFSLETIGEKWVQLFHELCLE